MGGGGLGGCPLCQVFILLTPLAFLGFIKLPQPTHLEEPAAQRLPQLTKKIGSSWACMWPTHTFIRHIVHSDMLLVPR